MKKTIKFASRKKLFEYIEKHFPDHYIIPDNFKFNRSDMYQKSLIIFKDCGCQQKLCPAGMQRGIKCKKCFGLTKHEIRSKRSQIKRELAPMSGYWGSLYYIRIHTNPDSNNNKIFYKIGVCKNGLQNRYSSREFRFIEPIFEIPFETRGEARRVELDILRSYRAYKIDDDDIQYYPLNTGHTEVFMENIQEIAGPLKDLTNLSM